MLAAMDFTYSVAGFSVGLIVGLTGVGGGSLMTPLLVLLFGIKPTIAVGTDLLYAALTKAGGTVTHARLGHVDWPMVRRLALGSIPASVTTIALLAYLPIDQQVLSSTISQALAVALILTAGALMFGKQLRKAMEASLPQPSPTRRTVTVGAVLGILVTISSVGAGAIGVVAIGMLYPKLSAHRIVGSDIAHAVPLTLVAGLGHGAMGHVDVPLLLSLLAGSLPGIWLGSRASRRVPEQVLRRMLAVLLLLVGAKLAVV